MAYLQLDILIGSLVGRIRGVFGGSFEVAGPTTGFLVRTSAFLRVERGPDLLREVRGVPVDDFGEL